MTQEKRLLRKTRPAFTLVEMLVVIAIISVLMALLTPAVQHARETSRRNQCSNHLKQHGVALLSFHEANTAFPYGVWMNHEREEPGCTFWSHLMTHLEQRPIHEHWVRTHFWKHDKGCDPVLAGDSGVAVDHIPIAVLSCPSSAEESMTYKEGGVNWAERTVQAADYAGVAGSIEGPDKNTHPDGENSGIKSFSGVLIEGINGSYHTGPDSTHPDGAYTPVNVGMIRDGTSQTMMVAETSDWCYDSEGIEVSCRATEMFPRGSCCGDWKPTLSLGVITVRHPIGVNDSSRFGAELGHGHMPIKSGHPGGALVLFADGSVHFLYRELDLFTLYGLADRNDLKVLDSRKYK